MILARSCPGPLPLFLVAALCLAAAAAAQPAAPAPPEAGTVEEAGGWLQRAPAESVGEPMGPAGGLDPRGGRGFAPGAPPPGQPDMPPVRAAREAPSRRPEHGRARVLERTETEEGWVLRRTATRTRYWEELPVDTAAHPEVLEYRIRWFSGSWSKPFYPGDGDTDWKGEGKRRVWSYFDDHEHEILLAPEAAAGELWGPLLKP